MTTSPASHALALRLIQETGTTLDQANAVMAKLYAAGIHLLKTDPPAEPVTGEKAEQTPKYAQVRARIQEAVRTGAKCAGCGLNAHPEFGGDGNYCRLCLPATKPTEYEEQHDA
jgi:hypothetical protein